MKDITQKEINEVMMDCHNAMVKGANEQAEKDSKVLAKVKSMSTVDFYKDVLEWMSDEDNGIIGYYNILHKPKGHYQTEDYGLIKGMWVDQYTTPMIEDDYHGYLTIKLENGKYFECSFNLG